MWSRQERRVIEEAYGCCEGDEDDDDDEEEEENEGE